MQNTYFRQCRCSLVWLLFLLLNGAATQAQTPDWQRALAVATTVGSTSTITTTAVDAGGNVIVTGGYSGTISLGSTTLNSGSGRYEAYVAKWSPATGWAWAVGIASGQSVYVSSVVVEGSNVYIAGTFSGGATFGNTTLTTTANSRCYVAKLLDAGSSATFGWVQDFGGAAYEYLMQLAVQGSNLYLVGELHSPAVSFGATTVTNAVYSTGYVAKLVDAGTTASFAWVQTVPSTSLSRLSKVAVRGSDVYVAGYFAGTVTFGATALASSNSNDVDVIVAKLADTGPGVAFMWARQAGGTGTDRVGALAVAGTSVYVAGDADSPRTTFGNTTLSGVGQTDIFLAKLTDAGPSGEFTWAQQAGGAGFEGVLDLAVRGSYVYACGFTTSTRAAFGGTTLVGLGDYDAFVARLHDAGNSGNFEWARQAGGSNSDQANALELLGPTQVVVSGYVNGATRFGGLTLSSPTRETYAFVATLDDATALHSLPARQLGPLEISPNPAHGCASVQLPALPAAATATLTVLDALGRTLHTQTAAPYTRIDLDLTGLAAGLYAVRVQAGAATVTRRLVVE